MVIENIILHQIHATIGKQQSRNEEYMMSIEELEEEIKEIEGIRERYRPGSLEWNTIGTIINDKKKELNRLRTGEDGDEDYIPGSCGGDCGVCGGGR